MMTDISDLDTIKQLSQLAEIVKTKLDLAKDIDIESQKILAKSSFQNQELESKIQSLENYHQNLQHQLQIWQQEKQELEILFKNISGIQSKFEESINFLQTFGGEENLEKLKLQLDNYTSLIAELVDREKELSNNLTSHQRGINQALEQIGEASREAKEIRQIKEDMGIIWENIKNKSQDLENITVKNQKIFEQIQTTAINLIHNLERKNNDYLQQVQSLVEEAKRIRDQLQSQPQLPQQSSSEELWKLLTKKYPGIAIIKEAIENKNIRHLPVSNHQQFDYQINPGNYFVSIHKLSNQEVIIYLRQGDKTLETIPGKPADWVAKQMPGYQQSKN